MRRDTFYETFIVLCTVLNVYLFSRRALRSYILSKDSHVYSYVGDDYPEHIPLDRPAHTSVPMTVQISPDTFPISGPSATEEWESINPPGYGFVRLGDSARLLCVAMFHQLHCIEKMRIFIDNPNDTHVGFPHQQHCMNYLRQSFLCKADMTLEPIALDDFPMNADGAPDLDFADLTMRSGSGVSHTCGDWETLYAVVGDNYVRWKASWKIPSPWDASAEEKIDVHSGHRL